MRDVDGVVFSLCYARKSLFEDSMIRLEKSEAVNVSGFVRKHGKDKQYVLMIDTVERVE